MWLVQYISYALDRVWFCYIFLSKFITWLMWLCITVMQLIGVMEMRFWSNWGTWIPERATCVWQNSFIVVGYVPMAHRSLSGKENRLSASRLCTCEHRSILNIWVIMYNQMHYELSEKTSFGAEKSCFSFFSFSLPIRYCNFFSFDTINESLRVSVCEYVQRLLHCTDLPHMNICYLLLPH